MEEECQGIVFGDSLRFASTLGLGFSTNQEAHTSPLFAVSQFTLYGQTKKNKPDFHLAMKTELSREFYATFLRELAVAYQEDKIKDGVFGAKMEVNITNDGPVTLELDSRKFAYSQEATGEKLEE